MGRQGRVPIWIVVRVARGKRLTKPNAIAQEARSRPPTTKVAALPLCSKLLQLHHVVLIRICSRWGSPTPRCPAGGLAGEASVRGWPSIPATWTSPCPEVSPGSLGQLLLVEVLLLPVNHPCRVGKGPGIYPINLRLSPTKDTKQALREV